MIYFNHSETTTPLAPVDTAYRLRLAQRALSVQLDDNKRLKHAMDEAGRRIEELRAENENLVAENVRLTGQVHAMMAVIDANLAIIEQVAR